MIESARRLRLMGVGDILDETVRLFRANFRLFVAISAALLGPWMILQVAQYVIVLPSFTDFTRLAAKPGQVPPLTGMLSFFSLSSVVVSVIGGFSFLLLYAAITHVTSERMQGRQASLGGACSAAFGRFWRNFGAGFLLSLFTGLMAMTIIGIPFAIYFGVRWSFFMQAVLLDNAGARSALSRSSSLVKGRWWRVVGIMLLASIAQSLFVTIPSYVVIFILGIIVGLVAPGQVFLAAMGGTLIMFVAYLITAAILPIVATLLYQDLRVRKEGYDLELLATAGSER